MRRLLASGVKKVLPSGAVRRLEAAYRHGKSKLASARYGNPTKSIRVIAVTGAYGKTTTARFIVELLKEAGHTVEMADTSVVDGDATLLQRQIKAASQEKAEFFVLDVTPELVQSKAVDGVDLDAVVVTSNAPEVEAVLRRVSNFAIIPSSFSSEALNVAQHKVITFGEDEDAEARIDAIKLYRLGTEVNLTIDHHTSLLLSTYLVGKANAFNVAAAVATTYVLGVAFHSAEEGIARLEGVKGNYEYLDGNWPYKVVVDGARLEESVRMVIESAREVAQRRLIVALDLPEIDDVLIGEVKKMTDRLIVVYDGELAIPGVDTVSSSEEAWRIASRTGKKDDTVLLIGSNYAYGDVIARATDTEQGEDDGRITEDNQETDTAQAL